MGTRILLSAVVAVFLCVHAEAHEVDGIFDGKKFEIELDETFNEIEGHWGDVKYDLDVDKIFNDVEGTIGGADVELDFDPIFHDVKGVLPCGKVDLDYDLTFKEIEGILCGEDVEIDFDDAAEVLPAFKQLVLNELLAEFPRPARRAVRKFITDRIRF